MKIKLFVLFLALSGILFSQQKIKIIDAENQKPIPFAKIILKDKDYHKNTEENGEIILDQNENLLEIKAFGYEEMKVRKIQSYYYLKPIFEKIPSVNIKKPVLKNTLSVGDLIDEKQSFGGMALNWTVANYFPFHQNYTNTPYIKSVKFISKIKNKNKGTIKLVLYKAIDGKPDNEIWKSYNIECTNNNTEYVLEKPIRFPDEGVFIGFEWINNKKNLYKEKVYHKDLHNYDKINFNIVYINNQKSMIDEIWVLGKIIWNNPDDKTTIPNNFRQESWLTYKEYLQKSPSNYNDNKRLSIQLKLTD